MIPEVFNNKEKQPKHSFLERDANLVLPFLTLGYGKKNIRERRGERERGGGLLCGTEGQSSYIKHLYSLTGWDSSEHLLLLLNYKITNQPVTAR